MIWLQPAERYELQQEFASWGAMRRCVFRILNTTNNILLGTFAGGTTGVLIGGTYFMICNQLAYFDSDSNRPQYETAAAVHMMFWPVYGASVGLYVGAVNAGMMLADLSSIR